MIQTTSYTPADLARLIDNTLLSPYATRSDFEALCTESREYGFKMVAVNPASIAFCREYLAGSEVAVGAAIAFPLGQTTLNTKLFETSDALEAGAQEIDYVINIGRLKECDTAYLEREMKGVLALCRQAGVICKAIYENCYLTRDEILLMCDVAHSVGPDFVKTSTGFGTGGATVEDVALMKQHVGESIQVKAAGGIRTLDDAFALIQAGATRLGTSCGAAIVDELRTRIGTSRN